MKLLALMIGSLLGMGMEILMNRNKDLVLSDVDATTFEWRQRLPVTTFKISEINKMIPTFESREMSKIFREKYAKIAVITPSYPSKHGRISDWPHSSVSFMQLQVFWKRKIFIILDFFYQHIYIYVYIIYIYIWYIYNIYIWWWFL